MSIVTNTALSTLLAGGGTAARNAVRGHGSNIGTGAAIIGGAAIGGVGAWTIQGAIVDAGYEEERTKRRPNVSGNGVLATTFGGIGMAGAGAATLSLQPTTAAGRAARHGAVATLGAAILGSIVSTAVHTHQVSERIRAFQEAHPGKVEQPEPEPKAEPEPAEPPTPAATQPEAVTPPEQDDDGVDEALDQRIAEAFPDEGQEREARAIVGRSVEFPDDTAAIISAVDKAYTYEGTYKLEALEAALTSLSEETISDVVVELDGEIREDEPRELATFKARLGLGRGSE